VTDRQTDKYHTMKHFCGEMYSMIRVESADDHFLSWFDVKRLTFHEDMRKERFSHFRVM